MNRWWILPIATRRSANHSGVGGTQGQVEVYLSEISCDDGMQHPLRHGDDDVAVPAWFRRAAWHAASQSHALLGEAVVPISATMLVWAASSTVVGDGSPPSPRPEASTRAPASSTATAPRWPRNR